MLPSAISPTAQKVVKSNHTWLFRELYFHNGVNHTLDVAGFSTIHGTREESRWRVIALTRKSVALPLPMFFWTAFEGVGNPTALQCRCGAGLARVHPRGVRDHDWHGKPK